MQPNDDAREMPAPDDSLLARVQGSLKERRAEWTRVMTEMRDLYQSGQSRAQLEIERLQNEKVQVERLLEQKTQELGALSEQSQAAQARARETEQHYQSVLSEAESALAEQGEEIRRLFAEFQQSPAHFAAPLASSTSQGDIATLTPQALREAVQSSQADIATLTPQALRQAVESRQADIATLPPQVTRELVESTKHLAERDAEIQRLRDEVARRDQEIKELQAQQYASRLTTSSDPAELEKLQAEVAGLKEEHRLGQVKMAAMVPGAELTRLREELAVTRGKLQEANTRSASAPAMVPAVQAERLKSELTLTREQLEEANRKAAAMVPAVQVEELRNELAATRQQLEEANRKVAAGAGTLSAAEAEKLRSELVRVRDQFQEASRRAAAANTMVPAAEAEKLRTELIRTRELLQEAKNKAATASTLVTPSPAAATIDVDRLQKELGSLKTELAEKTRALQSSVPAGDVEKLISELGKARSEMARLQQGAPAAASSGEIDQLRAELTILQEEVREKDRKLQEVQAKVSAPHSADNAQVAQYEAELIRYHRQLEADRASLNESIENLEKRNAELVQAAERAQHDLSHERAQLNQLRDELHIDLAFEDLAFLARKHLAPIQPAKKK